MARNPLADALMELFGSLNDEQKRAIEEALTKAVALIQGIIEAERAKKPQELPAQGSAQPADIPDMRGRWP